jgi:hypothetical protein
MQTDDATPCAAKLIPGNYDDIDAEGSARLARHILDTYEKPYITIAVDELFCCPYCGMRMANWACVQRWIQHTHLPKCLRRHIRLQRRLRIAERNAT